MARPSVSEFDNLLRTGAAAYNTAVGDWWASRCNDASHRKAYKKTVELTRKTLEELHLNPTLAVDYACGQGLLISTFLSAFPQTSWIGIDGSSTLLECFGRLAHNYDYRALKPRSAFASQGPRVRLVHSTLPNFNLPSGQAELAVLAFPNLIPDNNSLDIFNRNGYCHPNDAAVAAMLARFREMDPEDDLNDNQSPDERCDELLTARVFTHNLRKLLRPGALLMRLEYATVPRAELSELTRMRLLFNEGALEHSIKNKKSRQWFRILHSHFFRSRVILDVFHQTGDPSDAKGGYSITFFQAL